MKIYEEKNLRNFDFWSGAKDNAVLLTCEQLDEVEQILEDSYPDGMDATEINDLFWFDFDTICEWLGTTYEELTNEDDEEDEEEDNEE